MHKILKVTQFPPGPVPEGFLYYNRTTREIRLKTPLGEKTYGATYIPAQADALSINGYYPLYRNETLAKIISPQNEFVLYEELDLGVPAPPGVIYPLYMPVGVGTFQGNHIDPAGDLDNDGILNFRDVDLIGVIGLPTAGWPGTGPFVTSGSVSVTIEDHITDPDQGYTNNLGRDLSTSIDLDGVMIAPDGTATLVSPGPITLPDGYVLFLKEDLDPSSASAAISVQWFEDDGSGNLVFRETKVESNNPAVQLWEEIDSINYSPREIAYSSLTESAQYFEEDLDGNISPKLSYN